MVLLLGGCGNSNQKAYEVSKEAYEQIDVAYEIIEQYGSDIYEAWRLGIYEDEDMSIELLDSELYLSEDEIREGIVYVYLTFEDEDGYINATEEEKEEFEELCDGFFTIFEDDLFSACVWVVTGAYQANGKIEEAEVAIESAKVQMKTLSEEYSDYEHYPNLKEYYTTTSAFFDFCQNPTGSFEQVKETINEYRNDAREYISDLDYIFEE